MNRLRKRRAAAKQRGAILVELAFVVPVLMLIVVGMFEMGMAWRAKISTTQAVRQSVRVVSHLGNDPLVQVDREALLALRASMNTQWAFVNYVVIYKADNAGGMTNSTCHTASVTNVCNYYGPALLADLDNNANPTWNDAHSSVKYKWSTRSDAVLTPDHVGVFVEIDHDWQTNMFPGDGVAISGSAVMRVEPEVG